MAETDRENEPLDEKLRAWLTDEIERRMTPMHWRQPLQQLVSWAHTYRDGRALHDLLTQYPRAPKTADPEPRAMTNEPHLTTGTVHRARIALPAGGTRPEDQAERLAAGETPRRKA